MEAWNSVEETTNKKGEEKGGGVILQCMYMCIEYCMFIFDVIVY